MAGNRPASHRLVNDTMPLGWRTATGRHAGKGGRNNPEPRPGPERRPHFPRLLRPGGTRIRAVADPVIEGRSLVVEAIRSLAIACRAWAAYPSDHPNVTRAVDAAQARVS